MDYGNLTRELLFSPQHVVPLSKFTIPKSCIDSKQLIIQTSGVEGKEWLANALSLCPVAPSSTPAVSSPAPSSIAAPLPIAKTVVVKSPAQPLAIKSTKKHGTYNSLPNSHPHTDSICEGLTNGVVFPWTSSVVGLGGGGEGAELAIGLGVSKNQSIHFDCFIFLLFIAPIRMVLTGGSGSGYSCCGHCASDTNRSGPYSLSKDARKVTSCERDLSSPWLLI